MPSGSNFTILGNVPTSATIPIFVSLMEKKASFVANRMSAEQIRSTPPPIQPPCIAQMTGILAFCKDEIESCKKDKKLMKF